MRRISKKQAAANLERAMAHIRKADEALAESGHFIADTPARMALSKTYRAAWRALDVARGEKTYQRAQALFRKPRAKR